MSRLLDPHALFREMISRRLSERLSADESRLLRAHLRSCRLCRAVEADYRAQRPTLQSLHPAVPPRDLWARTAAALDREVTRRIGRPLVSDERLSFEPLPRRRRAPAVLAVLSGLALLVGALGGQVWLAGIGSGAGGSPTPFAITPQRLAIVEDEADGITITRTQVTEACPAPADECTSLRPATRQRLHWEFEGPPNTAALGATGDRLVLTTEESDGSSVVAIIDLGPDAILPGSNATQRPSRDDVADSSSASADASVAEPSAPPTYAAVSSASSPDATVGGPSEASMAVGHAPSDGATAPVPETGASADATAAETSMTSPSVIASTSPGAADGSSLPSSASTASPAPEATTSPDTDADPPPSAAVESGQPVAETAPASSQPTSAGEATADPAGEATADPAGEATADPAGKATAGSGELDPSDTPPDNVASDDPSDLIGPVASASEALLEPSPLPVEAQRIIRGVRLAGAPAWSADGSQLAFSAFPADGSQGPDLYLWRPGDQDARRITDDHGSYFASWAGSRIVGSRSETQATGRPEGASRATSFVLDPITGDSRTIEADRVWMPQVDAAERRVIFWRGELAQAGNIMRPVAGRLFLADWSDMDPFAVDLGTGVDPALMADPPPGPDLKTVAVAGLGTGADEVEVARGSERRPLVDWAVRWADGGNAYGIWIANRPDAPTGHLTVEAIAAERAQRGPTLIGPVRALRAFSLGQDRAAWVEPGDAGAPDELKVATWGPGGNGTIGVQIHTKSGPLPDF